MEKKQKVFLCLIIFLSLVSTYIWLKLDSSSLINDGYDHFIVSLFIYYKLKFLVFFLPDFLVENLFHYIKWHGTFVEFITAPFYFIFPFSQKTAVIVSSTVFLSILLIFTYLLGKKFFSPRTGILGSFILSMYPLIGSHARIYLADLPLTALTTAAIYFLSELTTFDKRKFFWFIFFSACALLTKFNFLLFIAGPFLIVSLALIKKKANFKLKLFLGILFPLLLFFIFCIVKLPRIFNRVFFCSWFNLYSRGFFLSLFKTNLCDGINYFFWLFYELFNYAVSSLFMILFLLGVFFLLVKESFYKKFFFLFTIGIPLFVVGFLFYIEYDVRYIMPVVPFLALVSANSLNFFKWKNMEKVLTGVVVIFAVTQHYFCFFNDQQWKARKLFPFSLKLSSVLSSKGVKQKLNLREDPFYVFHFDKNDLFLFAQNRENLFRDSLSFYPQKEKQEKLDIIMRGILEITGTEEEKQLFFLGKNREVYKRLLYAATKELYPLRLVKAENQHYFFKQDIKKSLLLSQYLILSLTDEKEIHADHINDESSIKEGIKALRGFFKEKESNFSLIKQVGAGETTLYIYKNKFL